MKPIKQLLFIAVLGMLLTACSLFRNKKANAKLAAATAASTQIAVKKPADSVKKNKPKAFKEIITAKAATDTGFFNIHKLDEKYYLEIPDALLGRDILLVSRIAKGAADNRPLQLLLR